MAGWESLNDTKVNNIKPRARRLVFPDAFGVIVLSTDSVTDMADSETIEMASGRFLTGIFSFEF